MVETKKMRIFSILWTCAFLTLFSLCGCGEKKDREIEVYEEPKKPEYTLAEVSRGNVVLSKRVTLMYSHKDSEELYFKTEGYPIKAVYVEKGDKVKAGELLAELDMGDVSDEYDNCLSSIELYETNLRFLNEQRDLALRQSDDMLESGELNKEGFKNRNAGIEEEYAPKIKEYVDLITYENLRKDYYGAKLEEGRIYAGIDGIVAFARKFSASAYSIKAQKVITILDSEKCSFTCSDSEYAKYMKDGQKCTIELLNGTMYDTIYHYLPDEKEMVFELEVPDYTINIDSKAYYSIILDERKDVIMAPRRSVHHAGDNYYVYYTDENNIRSVQYVEVGLEGNDYYEIVSGINEGDVLVLK